MNPLQTIAARDVTRELCEHIFDLWKLVWPLASGDSIDIAAELQSWRASPTIHFIIRDEFTGAVRAHALTFPREISLRPAQLALASWAASAFIPTFAGAAGGAAVSRVALDHLPHVDTPVALFQTPVPRFYEKLGCRLIDNDFFDGTHRDSDKSNPFHDPSQMIYPASLIGLMAKSI